MARGPIPDKPSDRPTVARVVAQASAYYRVDGNGAGGHLHIVLDDGNISDDDILFCKSQAYLSHDKLGVELSEALLLMTRTQRKKVYQMVRR